MGAGQFATTENSTARLPRWMAASVVPLGACVFFMLYAVLAGLWLQPGYTRLGPSAFFDQSGTPGFVAFWLWLASLPLALILGVVGASIAAHASARRALALGAAGALVLIVPVMVGAVAGRSVPAIFGLGGTSIELFLLLSLWFWARERSTLTGRRALSADLRIAGYMLLAFATWFICGIGAMPVLALYPEKMIEFGMRPLALNMMYAILAYFVIGWGLLFASQYVAANSAENAVEP